MVRIHHPWGIAWLIMNEADTAPVRRGDKKWWKDILDTFPARHLYDDPPLPLARCPEKAGPDRSVVPWTGHLQHQPSTQVKYFQIVTPSSHRLTIEWRRCENREASGGLTSEMRWRTWEALHTEWCREKLNFDQTCQIFKCSRREELNSDDGAGGGSQEVISTVAEIFRKNNIQSRHFSMKI